MTETAKCIGCGVELDPLECATCQECLSKIQQIRLALSQTNVDSSLLSLCDPLLGVPIGVLFKRETLVTTFERTEAPA